MITRTVVTRLAGETIGRDRTHLGLHHRFSGQPSNAEFIAEAALLLKMRGISVDDMDRVEFEVVED